MTLLRTSLRTFIQRAKHDSASARRERQNLHPTESWVLRVLGRPEAGPLPELPVLGKVLVTGGEGSLGAALARFFQHSPIATEVRFTDVKTMDVRDERNVMAQFLQYEPDLVVHFAASKHAPVGEEDPYQVMRTNVQGTQHVLDWCDRVGARCVVASTCKACDPETSYGASKLIAERMALNAGQSVARYYNVVETSGNVFEIWRTKSGTLPYTDGKRRFISLNEAVMLTVWVSAFGTGRYTLTDTLLRSMREILQTCYPERDYAGQYEQIPLRRGDRLEEPRHAACERMVEVQGLEWISRIVNPHDPPYGKER